MSDTIRLKFIHQEGKDYTGPATVRDDEGYEWNLAPNQTIVLPDDGNRLTLAANATVDFGTTTQQLDAPEVQADIAEQVGRV